ncbi:ABC transporter ATP-binding protein [Marvinbryantia formatexigens]|nr:ABC transporter ATP-binding protein [Marvinbryantia formatexigens]UWO25001.1 ABC transporter ATP-binding protein/permease [Marvinbryantia formatexigens DSM 14469]SDG27009.1 ATP-binding cassette, subfamily B [Marvinbryantia formatexigens]
MFKKVFEYAGPYRKDLYSATFIVLLSVLMGILPFVLACQIISPLVMGNTIDTGYVTARVAGVLVCLILQAVLYGWGLDVSHKAAYNTLLRLRTSLQKRFEQLPLGFIQDKGTGTIKKLFVDDVDSLEVLLAHSLPEGIANLMIPLAVYIAMFFIDWKLALLSLASVPVSVLAMMMMYSVGMKKMGPYYMAGQKMNNTIIEYVNGMEVVKVFNKDAQSYERFRKDVSDYRDYTLEWYKAAWPWMAVYSSLLPCTIILTLPLGAWFVLCGLSTLPDFILILCLSLSIGVPLLKSLGFLPTMPQLNYKIAALEQVLETAPLRQTEDTFHGMNHDICFDHVTFGYRVNSAGDRRRPEDASCAENAPECRKAQSGADGKPPAAMDAVITDVSFTAKTGQKTALVGESGSGKSTLAKLLIHYYDLQQGTISIGGQDITEMSLEALNSQISYVAQDQYLFNTSLLENIRMGRPGATDEEVLEAAKKAQCMEFLEKLPQGIHSMAGDAGKMLSGGQRQRISLARAILKNAPIVVLDEATAYADPENEEKMEAAIAELVKGKTLFVIAHRLPAIRDAGQICVIEHGRLAAAGTHEELLERCEEYQKLWKASQRSAGWKVTTANPARGYHDVVNSATNKGEEGK